MLRLIKGRRIRHGSSIFENFISLWSPGNLLGPRGPKKHEKFEKFSQILVKFDNVTDFRA